MRRNLTGVKSCASAFDCFAATQSSALHCSCHCFVTSGCVFLLIPFKAILGAVAIMIRGGFINCVPLRPCFQPSTFLACSSVVHVFHAFHAELVVAYLSAHRDLVQCPEPADGPYFGQEFCLFQMPKNVFSNAVQGFLVCRYAQIIGCNIPFRIFCYCWCHTFEHKRCMPVLRFLLSCAGAFSLFHLVSSLREQVCGYVPLLFLPTLAILEASPPLITGGF